MTAAPKFLLKLDRSKQTLFNTESAEVNRFLGLAPDVVQYAKQQAKDLSKEAPAFSFNLSCWNESLNEWVNLTTYKGGYQID